MKRLSKKSPRTRAHRSATCSRSRWRIRPRDRRRSARACTRCSRPPRGACRARRRRGRHEVGRGRGDDVDEVRCSEAPALRRRRDVEAHLGFRITTSSVSANEFHLLSAARTTSGFDCGGGSGTPPRLSLHCACILSWPTVEMRGVLRDEGTMPTVTRSPAVTSLHLVEPVGGRSGCPSRGCDACPVDREGLVELRLGDGDAVDLHPEIPAPGGDRS